MTDLDLDRLVDLTCIAWSALIQAQPNANPDSLAVKAEELAKAMLKVEEKMLGRTTPKA